MRIYLNGKEQELPDGVRLAELLQRLELSGQVAVEVNAEVIRRALHPMHALKDGDRVEIVTFVGGG